jgi:hypothetical protein
MCLDLQKIIGISENVEVLNIAHEIGNDQKKQGISRYNGGNIVLSPWYSLE